ncbi:MAG TPA: hypothetical protein VNZ58_11885 [Thermomicrobiales bacterium]|nr:hypothetical protein [Thermomicrobiales bacterium]
MSRQHIFEQFQEKPDSRLIGVVPVAAFAQTEHERLAVTQISLYSDMNIVAISLVLGAGHPEHTWREMGRPGHPFMTMTMSDDLGTEYVAMPTHGGGGSHFFEFNFKILPPIPDNAKTVSLSFAMPSWNGRDIQRFYAEEETPPTDWSITTDLSARVAPRAMTNVSTRKA